jgi:hypothetical protein
MWLLRWMHWLNPSHSWESSKKPCRSQAECRPHHSNALVVCMISSLGCPMAMHSKFIIKVNLARRFWQLTSKDKHNSPPLLDRYVFRISLHHCPEWYPFIPRFTHVVFCLLLFVQLYICTAFKRSSYDLIQVHFFIQTSLGAISNHVPSSWSARRAPVGRRTGNSKNLFLCTRKWVEVHHPNL